jgi:hypothetical protein
VPDNPDESCLKIKENKKVKRRTKIIFGTGESLQAITTTSNLHFVRAALGQVINVFFRNFKGFIISLFK